MTYNAPTSKGRSTPVPTVTSPILPGYDRFRKPIDFGNGANNCFDFEEALSFLCSPVVTDAKGRKGLIASPVYITDPCQNGNAPLKTATILPGNLTIPNFSAGTPAYLAIYRAALALVGDQSTNPSTIVQQIIEDRNCVQIHSVSAPATAQTMNFSVSGMAKSLAIKSTASGVATATLDVRVSTDGFVNSDIDIDAIAAAASTVKQYTETTVGATTALSPLSFRHIKIIAGSAGGADTTTLDIAMK